MLPRASTTNNRMLTETNLKTFSITVVSCWGTTSSCPSDLIRVDWMQGLLVVAQRTYFVGFDFNFIINFQACLEDGRPHLFDQWLVLPATVGASEYGNIWGSHRRIIITLADHVSLLLLLLCLSCPISIQCVTFKRSEIQRLYNVQIGILYQLAAFAAK